MNITPVWVIFIAAIFTNNILLASFLGMCSFLVCSNKIDTALGSGERRGLRHVLHRHPQLRALLLPAGAPERWSTWTSSIFIAVIAAFVQFVEMFIERFSPESVLRAGHLPAADHRQLRHSRGVLFSW